MKRIPVAVDMHVLASNGIVTVIIGLLVGLSFGNGLRRVEHLAHATVSLKIGIIAGLLAGLACWWLSNGDADPLPPAKISMASIPLLLGLVITVQGFETSRYLGHSYSQELRIKTMRHAQWLASVIYLAFLALLTPFLSRAAEAEGVAGILDIMSFVAPALGIFVLVGALASQLSAAVADSIGSAGLMTEVSRRKLGVPAAFALAGALAISVVWLTDPFQVVAASSRVRALRWSAMRAHAYSFDPHGGCEHPPARWLRRRRIDLYRRRPGRRSRRGLTSHDEVCQAPHAALLRRHAGTRRPGAAASPFLAWPRRQRSARPMLPTGGAG